MFVMVVPGLEEAAMTIAKGRTGLDEKKMINF